MNVQSVKGRAPQWVVGASSWSPTCRRGGDSPRSPRNGVATCWTRTADETKTTTLPPWWEGYSPGATRSGRGADCAGNPPPRRQPGARQWQMQDDPTNRALDPHGELEQPVAQRRDLRIGQGGPGGPSAEFLEQQVRRQREEDTKLVGQETRATGSVHLQPVMQFLEPVLHVPPATVELVDRLRIVGEVGHHEAGVVLRIAAGMADDLGLDDHPPLALPAPCGIPRLAVHVRRLAGGLGEHPGLAHQAAGPLLSSVMQNSPP